MSEQKITIDGENHKLDDLSDKAKADLASLQMVDQKIAQKQQDLAILHVHTHKRTPTL